MKKIKDEIWFNMQRLCYSLRGINYRGIITGFARSGNLVKISGTKLYDGIWRKEFKVVA